MEIGNELEKLSGASNAFRRWSSLGSSLCTRLVNCSSWRSLSLSLIVRWSLLTLEPKPSSATASTEFSPGFFPRARHALEKFSLTRAIRPKASVARNQGGAGILPKSPARHFVE